MRAVNIGMMGSFKHTDNEQKSPVSPLQFGNEDFLLSDDRTSSSSINAASDEDSPHSIDACKCHSHPDMHYNLCDIQKDRQTLKESLANAKNVSDGLNFLDVKLSNKSLKISNSLFTSFHAQCSKVNTVISRAMAQAAEFVKIYDAEHDVRRAVAEGPDGIDTQNYVQYVELLVNIIGSKATSNLSVTLDKLQESIEALIKDGLLVDRLWIARLGRIVSSLQKMSKCIQEESSCDLALLEVASQHLVRLWRLILTEYGMIIPLPFALQNSAENSGRLPPPPPPPLSPHLVLALRNIIQILASKRKEQVCLDCYKDIRSSKANESLQTLCPNYLEFCATQAFDRLKWVDLKSYTQLWKQHLEVLTTILLTVEYELCRQVFSSSLPAPVWKQCFAKLAMQAGLQSFIAFSQEFARCKHEPPDKLFELLDMVNALDDVKTTLKALLADENMSCTQLYAKLQNAQLLLVRAISKSFQHFRFQVDMQGPEKLPLDGRVMQLSITTLTSLRQLFTRSYEQTLRQAAVLQQNEKGEHSKEHELSHTIHHMLTSLERHINDAVAHMNSKGPTLSSLFLMNNYWYIYVALSKNDKLSSLLGYECLDRYREKANMYAHKYQREAWAPLLEYLGTEQNEEMIAKFTQEEKQLCLSEYNGNKQPKIGGGGGSWMMLRSHSMNGGKSNGSCKNTQKTGKLQGNLRSGSMRANSASSIHHEVHLTLELQRIRAFQVTFEGVCQQHKGWKIPDEELRETLGKAVIKLVVPAYETYLKSLMPLTRYSKAQVQLKYSVPMMETMIKSLFQIES
ncbi:hypothetical protein L7F22_000600 [Adiantum nelumboides]|nr:hypothetical protein [Adiantum nelumboides]